jgi:hypothetical protein
MSTWAVKFAAHVAVLGVATARLCLADVSIDARREAGAGSALQCPPRLAKAVAAATAPAAGALSVHAEFIDGSASPKDTRTLDLDVAAQGAPRPAFRVRFPPLRGATQFMLALFMNDGSSRAACVVQLPIREAGFAMEFPLAQFRQALGVADYHDVDYILLVSRRASSDADEARAKVLSISVTGRHEPGALVARCGI